MIPRRLITTWICDKDHSTYRESDKRMFYKCFESWHRLMPDYEIRIISMENVFYHGSSPWACQQMKNGNLIGVSDWARLWWLYVLGGVYVDMDLEALQRFDHLLLDDLFVGHFGLEPFVGNGVIGARPSHPLLSDLLDRMEHLDMLQYTGNDSGPRLLTNALYQSRGAERIYPREVFYPYHWSEQYSPDCIKPETVAVHHWASSWDQK